MYKRIIWPLAIVIPCFFGMGGITPAWAWGGGGPAGQTHGGGDAGGLGGHQNPRQCQSQYGQWSYGRSRYGRSQYGMSNGAWPYGPYIGATESMVPDGAPVQPQVVVLTNAPQPAPAPATAPVPMDLGYVPGCRAIPNGYHCDPPRQ